MLSAETTPIPSVVHSFAKTRTSCPLFFKAEYIPNTSLLTASAMVKNGVRIAIRPKTLPSQSIEIDAFLITENISSLSFRRDNRIVSRSVKPHVQRLQSIIARERTSLDWVEKLETYVVETQVLQDESQCVRIDGLMMSWVRIKIARRHDKIFGTWRFGHDQPTWSKDS